MYVHVPFCVRKCGYCDFYSLALPRDRREPDAAGFLRAIDVELSAIPADPPIETIFIGGGTPTELAASDLERLLARIRAAVRPERLREWTCEANPGTLTPEKARLLREAGVTRVSMGVQSFDAKCLAFLGRIHGAREALEAVELLRATGFDNVNIDLISAVPGAPLGRMERDLAQAVALAPEHISCYSLTFEEGTPLFAQRARGEVRAVPEDDERAEYELVRATLAAAGYAAYEISNYARTVPGRDLRCLHNLLYWGPGQFYAIGPAAHGHIDGERFANVRNLERYLGGVLGADRTAANPYGARVSAERLAPDAFAREALVFGLRRIEGISYGRFRAETGFDARALVGAGIDRLTELGLLVEEGDRLRLAEHALFLSDGVLSELV